MRHNSKVQLVSSIEQSDMGGHSLREKNMNPESQTNMGPLSPGELSAEEIKLDGSNKIVTVQLLLPKQRPQRLKMNGSHTILELYQHVKFLTKETEGFQLLNQGTQPPTTLTDPTQTAEDANLNRVRVKMELL